MVRFVFIVSVVLVGFSQNAAAQTYESQFADGMRHYAEGRHQDALASLYSAYAYEQTAAALGLIIRTHDLMGHCTAADRQRDLFRSSFRTERAPNPQRCKVKGTLAVSCPGEGHVVVNRNLRLECGGSIDVPVGRVSLRAISGKQVDAQVTRDHTTTIEFADPIPKQPPSRNQPRTAIAQGQACFKVWHRTHLRNDPDLNAKSEVPGFEVYQDNEGIFHVFADRLMPIKSERSESPGSD